MLDRRTKCLACQGGKVCCFDLSGSLHRPTQCPKLDLKPAFDKAEYGFHDRMGVEGMQSFEHRQQFFAVDGHPVPEYRCRNVHVQDEVSDVIRCLKPRAK